MVDQEYSAKDIKVLEGLKAVQKRPAMYIGSTGESGLHHLVYEVVDNCIDEVLAGYCKNISVVVKEDGSVKVVDDGRGIPVDTHKKYNISAVEVIMTKLHSGGKFDNNSYKVSGGLHGVGVSVVNALSTWVKAEVCRNGSLYAQEYKQGKPKAAVKKTGKCNQTGTTITFNPDPSIFKEIKYDWEKILSHLRQQAYLTKGITLIIEDKREKIERSYTFHFEIPSISSMRYSHVNLPLQTEVIDDVINILTDE